jgi:hypothetical protein
VPTNEYSLRAALYSLRQLHEQLFKTISDGFRRKNNQIRLTFFVSQNLAEIFSAAKFQKIFGG